MKNYSCHFNTTYSTSPNMEIVNKFQIVWGTISFILGIVGNVLVLYATIVHKAIKLDKMSVWIINNLAVTDICNCVLVLLPTLLTQYGKLAGIIIFGETFYEVMACYVYSFFVSSVFLVNFLSINKFMRCMFPLRNLNCSRVQKLCVTLFIVIVSSLPILWFAYSIFDGFQCLRNEWRLINYLGAGRIGHTQVNKAAEFLKAKKVITFLLGTTLSGLPCITLVIVNTVLIIFAVRKSNSSINKQNLLIVVLVTTLFLLSLVPFFVNILTLFLGRNLSQELKELAWSFLYISTWTNPFIYFGVNPTFRSFVRTRSTRRRTRKHSVNIELSHLPK